MNDELTREEIATEPTDPEEIRGVSEWQGAGAKLRQARERLNLSLEDVAGQIKIAPRKLTALEEERWQELPERPYLRGLVRNYARVLQLDAEPLMRSIDAAMGTSAAPQELNIKPALQAPFPHRPAGPHESPVNKLIAAGVLGCIVIIAALVVPGTPEFHRFSAAAEEYFHREPQPAVALESASPGQTHVGLNASQGSTLDNSASSVVSADSTASNPSSVAAGPSAAGALGNSPAGSSTTSSVSSPANRAGISAPSVVASAVPANAATAAANLSSMPLVASNSIDSSGAVTMQFRDDSWVELRQADGKVLSSKIYHGGTEQSIDVSAPLQLVIGNAPAVSLSYRGKPIDLDSYTRARVARLNLP